MKAGRATPCPLPDQALLQQERCFRNGLASGRAPGLAVCVRGRVVQTGSLGHVTEGLVDPGQVGGRERTDPPARVQRAPVQVRRLHVGVLGLGAVPRDPRVLPGLLVPPRLVEVERERLRLVVPMVARPQLEGLSHPGVDLPPPAVRQSLVRDVADQGVAEPIRPRRVDRQVLAQPAPHAVVGVSLQCHHGVQEALVEGCTEDRRVSQHGSVGRRQPVDQRGEHALDGVRKGLDAPRSLGRRHELLEEQRVAAGSLGEGGDGVGRERALLARRGGQRRGL